MGDPVPRDRKRRTLSKISVRLICDLTYKLCLVSFIPVVHKCLVLCSKTSAVVDIIQYIIVHLYYRADITQTVYADLLCVSGVAICIV